MNICKIITRSIILVACGVGIFFGVVFMRWGGTYWYNVKNTEIKTFFTEYEVYNGDAYTGIQQGIADVSYNISAVEDRVENVERKIDGIGNVLEDIAYNQAQILGCFMILLFAIAFLITLEKLIQAIIDCKKEYAQKREERLKRQLEYMEALKRLETAPEVTRIEDL
ncbi:MAG: hypothetical protein E7668_03535 [Ruminococcaceae bacterium]|nr:hypothetical protein [Oscillospiraceae bacterium]